jgi:hypothetical protein
VPVVVDLAKKRPRLNRKRRHRKTLRLLMREQLDGRSYAAKMFDSLIASIKADLGSDLTAIEVQLVEAFAGLAVLTNHLSSRALMLDGKYPTLDVGSFVQVTTALGRLGALLGLERRARNVTPSLAAYLVGKKQEGAA